MGKKRILIVDDSEEYLDSLRKALEILDYEVESCTGGWEAYDLQLTKGFDLVISDVRMPEGDGIELLLKIRKRDPNIPPVILMTGYTVKDFEELLEKGAHSILGKPFQFDELDSAIDSALAC